MKTKIPPLYAIPIMLLAAASIYFIHDFSYGLYYGPLCERHAEENGWQYVSFKPPYRSSPGACKFETPDGRSVRLEDWEMSRTSADYARWAVQPHPVQDAGGRPYPGGSVSRKVWHCRRRKLITITVVSVTAATRMIPAPKAVCYPT